MISESNFPTEEFFALLTDGKHDAALSLIARVEAPLPQRLRHFRALAATRAGKTIDALRWIQADPEMTPVLRRLEIEVLCSFRCHRAVVDRIKQSFEQFPENAVDFAFFAVNELVFHRGFFEARYVVDQVVSLLRVRQPGVIQDMREKEKYIDDTESLLDRILFDEGFNLIPVSRRFVGLDIPRLSWSELVSRNIRTSCAQVPNCFGSRPIVGRPVGSSTFYVSPSRAPVQRPELPLPKPTMALVLEDIELTQIYGITNFATLNGQIFPQLTARGSTTNAGFCVTRRGIERTICSEAFILAPLGDVGYFNAILNGLFGILVWKESFSDVPLVVPSGYNPVLKQYCRLLAIEEASVIWDANCESFTFKRGITLFNEGRSIDSASLLTFQSLSRKFLIENLGPAQGSTLVYISRRQARQRRLETEPEIEAILAALGFSIVCLESVTPSEQIQVCESAQIIVAPHGAGLTNIIFSSNLKVLIELTPDTYHVRGFENLARQLGSQYIGIMGQSRVGTDMANLAWVIDPETVADIAKAAIAKHERSD